MAGGIEHYDEFWLHYLREHGGGNTRALHYLGTAVAIALLAAFLLTLNPWFLPAAIVSGYLFAWIAHFAVERNRPATFSHPLWSLYSDFRMFFLWIAGRLGPHLRAAGVR